MTLSQKQVDLKQVDLNNEIGKRNQEKNEILLDTFLCSVRWDSYGWAQHLFLDRIVQEMKICFNMPSQVKQ